MISARKNAGKASTCLLVLISVGCFFATYNFLTMVGHGRGRDGPRKLLYQDGAVSFASGSDPSKRFHVALTATDALYSQWQSRIMHYWYTEMRRRPGSDMGGFTRILHSGKPDGLMDEIPTLVVDPLPEGVDKGYIVLNRPWAFVQWLQKADIKEDYILMAEPDHIFVKPLPNLAHGHQPAAFPFFYIKPTDNEKVLRKFFPEEKGPISNIDPIGNSPVIIQKGELTYGKIGEWRFDKRSYIRSPPPRNLSLPPPRVPESVATLVKMVNEATASIVGWEEER